MLVYSVRAKTRRQRVALLDFTGNVCIGQLEFFAVLPVSVKDHESAWSFTDLGVTN